MRMMQKLFASLPPYLSLLKTICDDYINTIGGHAYDPDCEDPGFVFKNFSECGTHSLYPRKIASMLFFNPTFDILIDY